MDLEDIVMRVLSKNNWEMSHEHLYEHLDSYFDTALSSLKNKGRIEITNDYVKAIGE